jgi:serine protease inhibitor
MLEAYYFDNPLFEAAQLFLFDGDRGTCKVRMEVFLPKSAALFDTFIDSLNTSNWNQWRQAFKFLGGTLALPNFKINAQKDLAETLKACGISNAFTPEANFCPIGSDVFVTECRQSVTFDVNEKGVEAASATELAFGRGGPPPKSFSMVVDRPFVVAICSDDAILFLAAVTDPR